MVTSHDVARLAGVSQPTVSRALRDSPKVSETTKRRVLQAARSLGYVISETGRALASGRSHRVGLLVTDLENQFYPYAISAMHRQLEELGYQLILHTETSDAETIAERLVAHSLDGVVLATAAQDSSLPMRLRDRGVPFVYFNRTVASVEADSATVDPVDGMRELAQALLERGHHRIAAIFGPRNTSTGAEREEALRDSLETGGLTIPRSLTRRGSFDVQTGYLGVLDLLQVSPRPTVVVCGNDVVALGALNACHETGIRVPEDLSVVGFDDLPPASWALVGLTTVGFDLTAMASAAARLLVERVEIDGGAGGGEVYVHERFESRLLLRRTLGAAPA